MCLTFINIRVEEIMFCHRNVLGRNSPRYVFRSSRRQLTKPLIFPCCIKSVNNLCNVNMLFNAQDSNKSKKNSNCNSKIITRSILYPHKIVPTGYFVLKLHKVRKIRLSSSSRIVAII